MSDMTNTTNSEATEAKVTATAKKSTKKSAKPVVAKKATAKKTKPIAKKSTKKSAKPVVAKKATAKKAVAKKASGEAKAPRGIGAYAMELLVSEPDVNKVLAAVQKKFPGAKTQVASIYWYRSQMNRAE